MNIIKITFIANISGQFSGVFTFQSFPTDKLMKILCVVECFDESHEGGTNISMMITEIRIDNE